MASVSSVFDARWRSGKHVGEAKPVCHVYVRRGKFRRKYDIAAPKIKGATVPNGHNAPWCPTWFPTTNYEEVPNVLEVRLEQDFDENGSQRLTMDIENVVYSEETGLAGLFRTIERGFLSPWRGYRAPARPKSGTVTDWYELIHRNAQILVMQGYGEDTLVPAFVGLIDDVDLTSKPQRITITARDFGKALTDQRVFAWAAERGIRDPITFADRNYADIRKRVGGGAKASSEKRGFAARFACDRNKRSSWISQGHDSPDHTEWVQIKVPRGRYEDVYLSPRYHNMEAYISVYAKADRRGQPGYYDSQGIRHEIPEGWYDIGSGVVPNTDVPYLVKKPNVSRRGRHYRLGRSLELGDDSIIRVSFRNLDLRRDEQYHAGVRNFYAIKRRRRPEAKRRRWILVDDVSDIVRVTLRWAGFKEWEVQNTGVRLQDKVVFNRGNYLWEIIAAMKEKTGFIFYMGDPSNDDGSIGVPIFKTNAAIQNQLRVKQVKDTDLLTGIQVKFSEEPLGYPIRVRGAKLKKTKGGRPLFGEATRRRQAYYRPPWADTAGKTGMAGLIKHVVHYDPKLKTQFEVEIAARLIALAEALQSATAVIEIPANPGFELDNQVSIVDTGTASNTRLWVSNRSSTFRRGESGFWHMTLGGAFIDTPDIVIIANDINELDEDIDVDDLPPDRSIKHDPRIPGQDGHLDYE